MRDIQNMAAQLSSVLPAGKKVTRVVPLTSGFSNETYLVEGRDLILRLPPSAGAMLDGHDVLAQARIYEALGTANGAPPVPEIVHIGDDPSVLGAPFFVMRRVPGESVHDLDMQPWFVEGSAKSRETMCRRWVSAIANLARLQPLDALGPERAPEDDLRMWRDFAENADCSRLVGLIDRLLTIPAPRSGPSAVVHGDAKLSNVMWLNGDISAVLDWEMALNGEPLADLGYMLYQFENKYHAATRAPKLTGMLTREEVITLWCETSGRSADGLFWHEIAQTAKLSAIIAEGKNMFITGRSNDPKLAIFKQSLDYYLSIVERMLDDGGS